MRGGSGNGKASLVVRPANSFKEYFVPSPPRAWISTPAELEVKRPGSSASNPPRRHQGFSSSWTPPGDHKCGAAINVKRPQSTAPRVHTTFAVLPASPIPSPASPGPCPAAPAASAGSDQINGLQTVEDIVVPLSSPPSRRPSIAESTASQDVVPAKEASTSADASTPSPANAATPTAVESPPMSAGRTVARTRMQCFQDRSSRLSFTKSNAKAQQPAAALNLKMSGQSCLPSPTSPPRRSQPVQQHPNQHNAFGFGGAEPSPQQPLQDDTPSHTPQSPAGWSAEKSPAQQQQQQQQQQQPQQQQQSHHHSGPSGTECSREVGSQPQPQVVVHAEEIIIPVPPSAPKTGSSPKIRFLALQESKPRHLGAALMPVEDQEDDVEQGAAAALPIQPAKEALQDNYLHDGDSRHLEHVVAGSRVSTQDFSRQSSFATETDEDLGQVSPERRVSDFIAIRYNQLQHLQIQSPCTSGSSGVLRPNWWDPGELPAQRTDDVVGRGRSMSPPPLRKGVIVSSWRPPGSVSYAFPPGKEWAMPTKIVTLRRPVSPAPVANTGVGGRYASADSKERGHHKDKKERSRSKRTASPAPQTTAAAAEHTEVHLVLPFAYSDTDPRAKHLHETDCVMFTSFLNAIHGNPLLDAPAR